MKNTTLPIYIEEMRHFVAGNTRPEVIYRIATEDGNLDDLDLDDLRAIRILIEQIEAQYNKKGETHE